MIDRWEKEAEKLMASVLGKPHRQTVETIAAALASVFEAGRQDAMKSEIAWEATTPYYKQFITQERYEGFKENGFHRWYKPYRCSSCNHTETATQALQVIAAGLETYDMYGNLRIIPLPDAHKIAQEALEKMKS